MSKHLVVFVSDIHIGDGSPTVWYQPSVHEPYPAGILDWILARKDEVLELVLLGDVVDYWTYPPDRKPPTFAEILAANPGIFGPGGKLLQVLDALDGRVTYVPGNHDMATTAADVGAIVSPGGHAVRFCGDPLYFPLGSDHRLACLHGHAHTLFNAPDARTRLAPLPVGHFVTRSVAYTWEHKLPPGQTVADLPDQGAPNGIDLSSLLSVIRGAGAKSITSALIDFIVGATGTPPNTPVTLADGSTITLDEVKVAYAGLWTAWVAANGGGEVGQLITTKAAIADFDGNYLGWFAQRAAFQAGAELVVMGHTHTPISGLQPSLVEYLNSGFECPSSPDIPERPPTFVVVDTSTMTGGVKAVTLSSGAPVITDVKAGTAEVVPGPAMDFSCYVILDNSGGTDDLTVRSLRVGHGYPVVPPVSVKAGEQRTFWIQDLPGIHGSDAVVTVVSGAKTYTLEVDCPTGIFSNKAKGTPTFFTRAGDSDWGAKNHVQKSGHPLFVRFVFP